MSLRSSVRTLSMPTTTTTTTIATADGFNVQGTAGKLMSVVGDVASSPDQHVNYASISSSDATGGGRWVAYNSTDVSGNTDWIFTTQLAAGKRGNFFPFFNS